MPKTDNAVANPPKGGDQTQASTNDDNVNNVLSDKPYVVAISDGDNVGVFGRFADQASAEAAAAAARVNRPKRIDIRVVKENDINNGLPALVAEVAEAKAATYAEDDATPAPAPASTKASSTK